MYKKYGQYIKNMPLNDGKSYKKMSASKLKQNIDIAKAKKQTDYNTKRIAMMEDILNNKKDTVRPAKGSKEAKEHMAKVRAGKSPSEYVKAIGYEKTSDYNFDKKKAGSIAKSHPHYLHHLDGIPFEVLMENESLRGKKKPVKQNKVSKMPRIKTVGPRVGPGMPIGKARLQKAPMSVPEVMANTPAQTYRRVPKVYY